MIWATYTVVIVLGWAGVQTGTWPDNRAHCAALLDQRDMDDVYGPLLCEHRTWARFMDAVEEVLR